VPLSSREIADTLAAAAGLWDTMTRALQQMRGGTGHQALGQASEALLAVFEQLTERYERSMQILMG